MALFSSFFSAGIWLIISYYLRGKLKQKSEISLSAKFDLNILFLILIYVLILILESFVIDFFQFSVGQEEFHDAFKNNFLISIFAFCFIGPISEEILFRGFLFLKLNEHYNYTK